METTPLPATLSGGFPSNFAASAWAGPPLRRTRRGAIHGPPPLGADGSGHPWPTPSATPATGWPCPKTRTVPTPTSYVGQEEECGYAADRYRSLKPPRKKTGRRTPTLPRPAPLHSPRGGPASGWRHPCRLSGLCGSVLQAGRLVPRTARDVTLCLPRPLALPHCPHQTSQGAEKLPDGRPLFSAPCRRPLHWLANLVRRGYGGRCKGSPGACILPLATPSTRVAREGGFALNRPEHRAGPWPAPSRPSGGLLSPPAENYAGFRLTARV